MSIRNSFLHSQARSKQGKGRKLGRHQPPFLNEWSVSLPEYRFFEALRAPALLFGINMPNQGMFMWRVEESHEAVRSEARELSVKKLPFLLRSLFRANSREKDGSL